MILALLQILLCAASAGGFVWVGRRRTHTSHMRLVAGGLAGGLVGGLAGGLALGIGANLVEMVCLLFMRRSLGVYAVSHSLAFLGLYLLEFLALAVILGFLVAFLRGRLAVNYRGATWHLRDVTATVACLVLATLAGIFLFLPLWFANYFGILSVNQLVFMVSQINGAATDEFHLLSLTLTTLPLALILLVLWSLGILRFEGKKQLTSPPLSRRVNRRALTAGLSVALVGTLALGAVVLPVRDIVRSMVTRSTFIEEHYVAPSPSTLSWPGTKRIFIHIYMESMESSYFSKAEGGYMEKSLMPDMAALMKEPGSVTFSNREGFGGPIQTYAAGHSVAGMVNMWAGVPMLSPGPRNGSPMSYPDFTTLGDILKARGYNTEFMVGSDANWGGIASYYRTHGGFTIFDIDTAKEQHRIPSNYLEWWGFEDDKLYDYAKDEITRLAGEHKPFYLVVENADTHFPDGYVSKKMTDKPFDQQYANVIHYSQKEVVRLVRWLQAQPFWKDTTVLITGDHLSMDRNFFQGWDPAYQRTILNLYLNPAVEPSNPAITHNRTFASFDFFPTTLAALGATLPEHRMGIGTDLFSGQKTLLETYGVDDVDTELEMGSKFYDEHRHPHEVLEKLKK